MTTAEGPVATFGADMRRRRLDANITLTRLAELSRFSKSYLSKLETGVAQPTVSSARRIDAALSAGGALAALADLPEGVVIESTDVGSGDLSSANPDTEWIRSYANSTQWTKLTLFPPADLDARAQTLESFRVLLRSIRDLGQILGPSSLMPMLVPQILVLLSMAERANPDTASEVWKMAAYYADFTGWMAQEMGDDTAAVHWTNQAVVFARRAQDEDIIAYTYVRRANIAMYQHDARLTVEFARQAQQMECSDRVRSLAKQREAQGHALAGDYNSFMLTIEEAEQLANREPASDRDDENELGPARIKNPLALAKGWALHDLGRNAEAATILEAALQENPKPNRARARIGARLALTLATNRHISRACEVLELILLAVPTLESATIRADLRQVNRVLNIWHDDPAVRRVMPVLSAALIPGAPPRPQSETSGISGHNMP